ncbi:MAG: competence protein ComEC [Lysobacterales bacterium]|jgi:competence protein ComEC
MKFLAWIIPGLFLPLLFPVLPGKAVLLALITVSMIISLSRKYPAILFFLCGFAWTVVHLDSRLDQRISPLPGNKVTVTGFISDLPKSRGDMQEFRFQLSKSMGNGLPKGSKMILRWYKHPQQLKAGESWKFAIKLKPARSRLNFNGPDRERWYFAEGISVLGIVDASGSEQLVSVKKLNFPALRQKTRDSIAKILIDHQARPLILALALAEKNEIPVQAWARYRSTGTSHLLAISGMHVGLAAIMGFWLGRLLLLVLPLRIGLLFGMHLSWLSSSALAVLYSLMAGLGTSTRRALVMILVFYLVSMMKRNVTPWQGLFVALLLLLVLNPLAPLAAGFWFSFFAVSILLLQFCGHTDSGHWFKKLILAQTGLVIAMLPIGMFWFQQATLLGLVSNFIAIPWVSFAVVPATLLAIITLPFDTWLSPFLLLSAAESVALLDSILEWIARTGQGVSTTTRNPGMLLAVTASIGGIILLIPGVLIPRYLGLMLLMPLALPIRHDKQTLYVEMLDVGQGLAVLVETPNHLLLYDTGPGDGESWSMAATSIVPAIASRANSSLDRIIVSHGDLDHAGGLFDLMPRYSQSRINANLGQLKKGVSPCTAGDEWYWDSIQFIVLHPSTGLPYLGNDSSCVIEIKFAGHKVLLTGDISTSVENRLVGMGIGPQDILFAPHHGSKSSSSKVFVETLQPKFGLISTAFQNKYNFPHPEVKERFARSGVPLLNTADCGAVKITLRNGSTPQLSSARRKRNAIWRWPPEADCP